MSGNMSDFIANHGHISQRTHNCPVCRQTCNVRCQKKGHVAICKRHGHSYVTGGMCVSCDREAKEEIAQRRKEAERQRAQKEHEKKNPPERKERTKARKGDKAKKRQEQENAEAAARAANHYYATWEEYEQAHGGYEQAHKGHEKAYDGYGGYGRNSGQVGHTQRQ